MKNQILTYEYIRNTRYVFRISKFIILTYKNTIIISLLFFRILVNALASDASAATWMRKMAF